MIANTYDAMSLSQNAVLRNCSINCFTDLNLSTNPALIENCNITIFAYWGNGGVGTTYLQPYAIFRKCYLGLYNYGNSNTPVLNLHSPSEFHNSLFYSNYYDASTSSSAKSWSINYNSCVVTNTKKGGSKYDIKATLSNCYLYQSFLSYTYGGVTVGPSNHKEYPSTPVITSTTIDSETDEDGNLHVKISAEARY